MDEQKYVLVTAFITITKALYAHIHELMVGMQVLRVALMNAKTLPVPADYLIRLDGDIRADPRMQAAMEAVKAMEDLDTSEKLAELLRKFEGPIQ